MSPSRPRGAASQDTRTLVRSVSPDVSVEELASIVAAIELLDREQGAEHAATVAADATSERLDGWVTVSRRVARRSGMSRGLWRISGRVARRSRA